MRGATLPIAGLALVALLSGCIGSGSEDGPDPGAPDAYAWTPGVHPWPAGDEWPTDLLNATFTLAHIEHVKVPSFDGTALEGWIYHPDLPAGTRAPVVLWSLPYIGQTQAHGEDPALRDNSGAGDAVPVDLLVSKGYVVAAFSVRGSGNSDGCLEMFGPREQQDQVALVEWLGTQSWSNGRVGMMGLSYHGTTPWEAAIFNPPHLKTIVVAGMVSDLYTFFHTPQGAAFTISGAFETEFVALTSATPPVAGLALSNAPSVVERAPHWGVEHAAVTPDRVCPEVLSVIAETYKGQAGDSRDAPFWNARRLIDRFPDVTASVLLTHGFQDLHGSGHQTQESAAWAALEKAPKRQLEGQWMHEFPNFNSFRAEWAMEDWNDRLLEWLDFWLKGIGEPPRVGVVDFQDGTGAWHDSTAWPPAEARREVLYLADGRLSNATGTAGGTFRSAPDPVWGPLATLCPDAAAGALPRGLVFTTEAAGANVTLAGNPFAYLRLSSDLPGGLVSLHLYDLAPEFACAPAGPTGARLWAAGVADLRFLHGNFEAEPFPTGMPVGVRLDIPNLAEVLAEGHRLAAVVDFGEPSFRTPSTPLFPTLTVAADGGAEASHLVLPVLEGTLGGAAPTMDYPLRPFVPRSAD